MADVTATRPLHPDDEAGPLSLSWASLLKKSAGSAFFAVASKEMVVGLEVYCQDQPRQRLTLKLVIPNDGHITPHAELLPAVEAFSEE